MEKVIFAAVGLIQQCLTGTCGMETPEKPQRRRERGKQGTKQVCSLGPASCFLWKKAFLSVFSSNFLTAFYISWLPQATR